MCGIAGLIRRDGGTEHEATRARARAMRAALRHRGPDGEGEALLPGAILEHTRLALLDRAGGAQPMTSPDGRYTIVYNGEVYDHEELRPGLDYPFTTRSDAETVLAAYIAHGPECVHMLNGMFAFFVWDARARRGFLARDPLGVKPCAYAWDGHEFLFASEAHVVARARGLPVRGDSDAILEVLVAPCFSGVERPMFAGVQYLQPGHWLELGPEGPSVHRYYRYTVGDGPGPGDAALRAALARAVRRTCRADEPIGVFLSGGLDSTAIAAFAARCLPAAPPALTIAFAGMQHYDYAHSTIVVSDDLPFARLAARALGLPLTVVDVPPAELARDLERLAISNDALPAWEQELAQDRLARAAAAAGLKAVLVGDAAAFIDPLFSTGVHLAAFGARYYWLSDPDDRTFEIFELQLGGLPFHLDRGGRARPSQSRYRLIATVPGRAETAACGPRCGRSSTGTARCPLLPGHDRRPILRAAGAGLGCVRRARRL